MEEAVSNRIDKIMNELSLLFPPSGIPDENKYPRASKFVGGFMILVEIYKSEPESCCGALNCILDEFDKIRKSDNFLSAELDDLE